MAEAARLPIHDTLIALDELLASELVEFDPKSRVLRLCELPDAGEYPSNGNILRGWWSRFKTVPQCAIRDAHIRTVRWIMDQGAADKGSSLSHHHHEAWGQTFGTIPMPSARRRGVKRVADSDTSTQAQPGLFQSSPIPPSSSINERGSIPSDASPVDNSAAVRQMNEFSGPETVSKRFGEGEGEGEILVSPEIRNDPPERSRSENVPRLTLVPPYTLREAMEVLRSSGGYDSLYDDMHQEALCSAHLSWVASRVGLEDLRALAQYMAISASRVTARDLVGSESEPAMDMRRQVAHARRQLEERADRIAMLKEFRKPTTAG